MKADTHRYRHRWDAHQGTRVRMTVLHCGSAEAAAYWAGMLWLTSSDREERR